MSKYRIQGDIVSIKEEKAIELFDTYFDEHCPIESIMLQKGRLDIANDRDNQDYSALSSCIDIYKVKNILDIGCGYGRWLEHFLSSPPLFIRNLSYMMELTEQKILSIMHL